MEFQRCKLLRQPRLLLLLVGTFRKAARHLIYRVARFYVLTSLKIFLCFEVVNHLLRIFCFSVSLLFVLNNSYSQNWLWAKGEGGLGNDAANSIAVDEDGNTYVTGNLAGEAEFSGVNVVGNGVYDVFLAKYDAGGNLLWVKNAGSMSNDQGNAVKYKNGFLYLTGYFNDTAHFENMDIISKGDLDVFVAKYSASNGGLVWVRGAGGPYFDYAYTLDLDDAGNIYIGGYYNYATQFDTVHLSTSNIFSESFIAKYSNSGSLIWAKSSLGSATNQLTGLAFDNQHSIYVTGFFSGNFKIANSTNISSATQSYDIFLAKIDLNGNAEWIRRAGSIYEDASHAVACDKSGNAIINGYFAGTANFGSNSVTYFDYNDVFTAKYDTAGNNLWARAGRGHQLDAGFAVTTDDAGNIFATGIFEDLIDFDGNILDAVDKDIFVVSYDANGNLRFAEKAGDISTECGLGIAVEANGKVNLCGYYEHTCNFGTLAIEYSQHLDLFIAEFNPPFVGISEVDDDLLFSVFPNPGKTEFTVCDLQYTVMEKPVMKIFDVNGKKIVEETLTTENRKLQTGNWQRGIYFVEVSTAEKSRTVKLIVE